MLLEIDFGESTLLGNMGIMYTYSVKLISVAPMCGGLEPAQPIVCNDPVLASSNNTYDKQTSQCFVHAKAMSLAGLACCKADGQ